MRVKAASAVRAGFTLVEVIVSISLVALILGSAYACLSAGFSAQKIIEPRADLLQTARVALGLISADLRSACALPGPAEFLGMQRKIGDAQADNIDFATHNYTPTRPEEGDFCEMSVFLDKNPETGKLSIWRRRNPRIAMDPLSGGMREELATGVKGLRFEYTDGLDWFDTWGDVEGKAKQENSLKYRGNLTGLPEAIRITLLMDSDIRKHREENSEKAPPPMVFKTVVRLNLASVSTSSGTGSSASPMSADGAQNPGTPVPQTGAPR